MNFTMSLSFCDLISNIFSWQNLGKYKPRLQESYHITAEIPRRSGTNPEHNPQLNPSGAAGIRCGNWSASWHFSLVSPEGRSFSSQNKPDSYRGSRVH